MIVLAGDYRGEPVTARLPLMLYSAICPRCLVVVPGIRGSAGLATTEATGSAIVERVLRGHACHPMEAKAA